MYTCTRFFKACKNDKNKETEIIEWTKAYSLETFIETALSDISGSSYYCDNKCSTVLAAYTHADLIASSFSCLFPASNDMFKVNNSNTRTRCEIYSKLTIKTLVHTSF